MEKGDKKNNYGWLFVLVCILGTIWIEYMMIHEQTYKDWGNVLVALQTYVIITCLTMLIYFLLFRRTFRDILAMMMFYVVLLVIPIGTIIALKDNYQMVNQLLDLRWLFTHDFFYIVMVCQAVLTWILLVHFTKPNIKKRDEVSEDINQLGAREYEE